MSNQPEDWEHLIERGRRALQGALRKGMEEATTWLEDWQRPKQSPYRAVLLTEEQYKAMAERQGGVCAICSGKPKSGRLAVDHIHGTTTVRGLLCNLCNSGLGLFKDDPNRLAAAIEYLKGAKPAS